MQIVGYETAAGGDGESAGLLTARDGTVEAVSLARGRTLTYRLGARRCAGRVDDGVHEPCRNSTAPYCPTHTDRWPCARCTGGCDRPLPTCHEPHAIYLAGFRPARFKVGVTRDWRLRTRLREQGADRGAHLRTVADGRTARQIEANIAAAVGDSVRVDAKCTGLHEPFDETAWQRLLAGYDVEETVTLTYDLDLHDRPVRETIATGTVRGTKGRILLLDLGGSAYAVDLRDLVGYETAREPTDRRLQSSLGAWE